MHIYLGPPQVVVGHSVRIPLCVFFRRLATPSLCTIVDTDFREHAFLRRWVNKGSGSSKV
jgi:hypothetical protein